MATRTFSLIAGSGCGGMYLGVIRIGFSSSSSSSVSVSTTSGSIITTGTSTTSSTSSISEAVIFVLNSPHE